MSAVFESGIALIEYSLIAEPKSSKIWFHVEQAPVQDTAPVFWVLLKVVVGIRRDDLKGQVQG
ncbi:MAG: hypothetical protein A2V58_00445 [Candidatus Muproteobacteria bacterium RBG_19FT_COMBO_61_10]|uniref:Uncharacterized protein n=1 Tax=Candidatus Muproteobacteria bacterium RBG_19FT_COMBO_61_10 TaxID=1817761 RepID=A0A1F6UJZ4_9PROT|nr:MAG: hypothetical protein A2V58_00445 [Candidatus Muproteobacteria bacterium RBG_19FT_COMBO_61_10]